MRKLSANLPLVEKPSVSLKDLRFHGMPRLDLPKVVNDWREDNWAKRLRNAAYRLKFFSSIAGKLSPEVRCHSELYLGHIRPGRDYEWLGLASVRVVTNNGVGFIVDAWQNILELEIMKYHGIGTGTNAEAAGDSALQTELTTVYNPDSTRATGSLTETSANIFRTVGTNTVDGSAAITEHGILSQAATGGGTLLDRSVFSAVNLVSGDSLQSTYDLTLTAGS